MNNVGIQGTGESVWLGWFLYDTLMRYSKTCRLIKENTASEDCIIDADKLKRALDRNCWDGNWYLRGFFDDGSLLGSAENAECMIDSISQSWSVLSGAGNDEKCRIAMKSVLEHLVDSKNSLVLLLKPPFNHSEPNPGYIMGYPPGIRENGGQYTHAAVWVAWAFAKLGMGDTAEALFKILNPIYHSDSPEKRDIYSVEPYVVAADVYSNPACTGKGGWTWYTGASGWLYRLGTEAILGISTVDNLLYVNPCIPSIWDGYKVTLKRGNTSWNIDVKNPDGVCGGVKRTILDGEEIAKASGIALKESDSSHNVTVIMGVARN